MTIGNQTITEYCINKSSVPSKKVEEIENYTKNKVPMSKMLIGKLEASFLGFLLRSIKAKRVLEIGTFTGYSALAMAEQLPPDGELITLDINRETTELAKSFWNTTPHGKKITSIHGNAQKLLSDIKGPFDLIFIDADKENYLTYLKAGLNLIGPQGVIAIDNVLWDGKVLLDSPQDEETEGIKKLNDHVFQDESLYKTMLPIRDGVLLIRKNT
jgi:caffeoyl-CoA O-methyltransferase